MAKYFNESELSYKTLLAGAQQPVVTDVVKITPGEYVLGTLLANDGSGNFAPVDSNAALSMPYCYRILPPMIKRRS